MNLHKSFLAAATITLVIVTAGAQSAHSETGPEADSPKETQDFAQGRILVKAEERAPASAISSLNRKNDARTEEKLTGIGVSVIDLPKDLPVAEAVKRYENAPGIEYAEPDYEVQPEVTPSDPSYPRMYALNNTGQVLDGTPGADIGAPEAWSVTTGSANTVVAVIDSGVDISHPDLNDNIWTNPDEIPDNGIDDDKNGYVDDVHGWDFFNNNASVFDAADGDRHGTHVAGTIAAEGNNGAGVTGVNWRAKIMPLKFIGPEVGYTSGAIAALDYAVAEGVKVSNNSWGRFPFSQSMLDAIKRADAAGHLFVASAGNAGVDTDATPHYPSGYDSPNIISVAASDQNDSLAVFSNGNGASNYGATSVDLAAPGDYILSTTPGNTYSYFEGTSMASPHVAGVAALIKSQNPTLDDAGIKSRVLSSVDKKPNLVGKVASGGRLNAAQALGIRFTQVGLSGSPQTLKIGAGTTLSGGLTTTDGDALGGRQVILQQRPVGATFTNVGQTTTASDGTFRFSSVKPQKHTDYRAYFPGNSTDKLEPSTSSLRRVNVQVAVSLATKTTNLKLGNARPVVGAVNPSHAGSSVTLTIKRNGSVIARRSVALNQDSRYRFDYKPGRPGNYAFFATFPNDNDHFGNRSVQKSYKVVR